MDDAVVWVIQRGNRPRFAFEPLPKLRPMGDVVGQHLDCDIALQARVSRAIDVAQTRKSFRMPVVLFSTFHNGEIAYARHLYDFTGLLVQIGVLKAAPA